MMKMFKNTGRRQEPLHAMINMAHTDERGAGFSLTALILIAALGILSPHAAPAESLYVGDVSDNSVKRFEVEGMELVFQGAAVKRSLGGLKGPRGILVDAGNNLIVSDQNVGTAAPGSIQQYSSLTGKLLNRIVNHSDPAAPSAPRGIVLSETGNVFIADFTTETRTAKPPTPGRVRVYTEDGVFLTDLVPDDTFPIERFHPRGLVIGPDGYLYVSNFPDLMTGVGGDVLRFTTYGDFVDVFIQDDGGVDQLNRPEGLVFGPDGMLYITSFRANASDIDSIRIYDGDGEYVDRIELDEVGGPRAFAQALLFGPGGDLFVPISGNGPDTGAVRRYDLTTKEYYNAVLPSAQGGPLGQPWFLTFEATDPGSLQYDGL
jgi:DNA-binding beta-propeller fold protein YncE